ncbi:MAG TPA: glycerol-3-phosphate 1-O-acyltransferase PlsY [Candidatus Dormibacteraeota bacterium]|jgi:glycerol-3-phosphate acyltransferase PlsY|nr:glycerol-3-phosphate 1-O-acyltransferase PlsY [Candidatus Dormibacteraeota bacterium]
MAPVASDLAATAAGYTLGSLPVGLWLGRRVRHIDVRKFGSGSIGTTNVLRTVGPAAAATTFALDVAKGSAAILVARALGADAAGQAAAGFAAVVGHSWPALAKFHGGKSVATAFGGLLVMSPVGTLSAMAVGLPVLVSTRIVSVGSLSAALGATAGTGVHWALGGRPEAFAYTAGASALVLLRHKANLRRLARGEEPRVSLRRRPA